MDKAAFYDVVRADFGALSQDQVDGFERLLGDARRAGIELHELAYDLATTWHETAATMQPIAEYGKGEGYEYGEPTEYDGQIAYGRGYVQLTWVENYERADEELKLEGELLADFDLALDPEVASRVLFRGCHEGWFTGASLPDFVNAEAQDYYNARKVLNGLDKAETIKGYALTYERALVTANYGTRAIKPRPSRIPRVLIFAETVNIEKVRRSWRRMGRTGRP